jgi:AbrB family looped-hinge helix DNA binding protein
METFEAKITSKGRITLPAKIRNRLQLQVGDKVIFTESTDGTYRIDPRKPLLRDLRGFIRTGEKVTGGDIARWIEEAPKVRG